MPRRKWCSTTALACACCILCAIFLFSRNAFLAFVDRSELSASSDVVLATFAASLPPIWLQERVALNRMRLRSRPRVLGSTSEGLDAAQRARLSARVEQARKREPRNRCPKFVSVARKFEAADFDTVIATSRGADVFVHRAEETRFAPRKWCDMRHCFNASRPACRSEGPIPTYWYQHARGANPCKRAPIAARAFSTLRACE